MAKVLEGQGYRVPPRMLQDALVFTSSAEGVPARPGVDANRPNEALAASIGVDRWEVPAAIMDDGEVYVRRFDATGYFEQAAAAELAALAAQDFRYSTAADRVSDWAESRSNEVRQLYAYLKARNQPDARTSSGFAVEVSWSAAAAWIRKHRPHLAGAISPAEPGSLMPRILTPAGEYVEVFPVSSI
jgi:hypothetical protein